MANLNYLTDCKLTEQAQHSRKTVLLFGIPIGLVCFFIFPPAWWVIALILLFKYWEAGETFRAGAKGEQIALAELSKLPDSYTVFNQVLVPRPNSNKNTEIDFVVVGENGIFIVEVKHNNSKIYGQETGDWTVHKIGQKGTRYTTKMRNPIKQLKGQIWALSDHLKKHNQGTWIEGMVFLSNRSSKFKFDGTPSVKIIKNSGIAEHILNHSAKRPLTNKSQIESIINQLKS